MVVDKGSRSITDYQNSLETSQASTEVLYLKTFFESFEGQESGDSKRVSAKICGFLRFSAKICGFLRKSASPKCYQSQEKRNLQKSTKKLRISLRLSDSSFAPAGKNSQTGIASYLTYGTVRHVIHWQSCKEGKMVESSAESELHALMAAYKIEKNFDF